ncbi:hypothetical protein ACNO8X_26125 [Mycobacterium sp. PDNC021]
MIDLLKRSGCRRGASFFRVIPGHLVVDQVVVVELVTVELVDVRA